MMKLLAMAALVVVTVNAGPSWNSLETTWGLNPFSQVEFAVQPRTTMGDMKGFVRLDDLCSVTGAPFVGQRYMQPNDPSLVLIYDKNGYIAGMQTMIPMAEFTPPSGKHKEVYVAYKGYWILTIYYVDPSTVCTTGRTAQQFADQGTGTGLWIQMGATSSNTMVIPMKESEMAAPFIFGHCFYTMGNHWWNNPSLDMDCNDWFPYFILYNKGQLNAWGWATNYSGGGSKRYEHPTYPVISKFMKPVPKCINTNPAFAKLSTMHVYMTFHAESRDLC